MEHHIVVFTDITQSIRDKGGEKGAFIQLIEMNDLALLKGVSETVGAKSWRQDTKQMQRGKPTSVICTHTPIMCQEHDN